MSFSCSVRFGFEFLISDWFLVFCSNNFRLIQILPLFSVWVTSVEGRFGSVRISANFRLNQSVSVLVSVWINVSSGLILGRLSGQNQVTNLSIGSFFDSRCAYQSTTSKVDMLSS